MKRIYKHRKHTHLLYIIATTKSISSIIAFPANWSKHIKLNVAWIYKRLNFALTTNTTENFLLISETVWAPRSWEILLFLWKIFFRRVYNWFVSLKNSLLRLRLWSQGSQTQKSIYSFCGCLVLVLKFNAFIKYLHREIKIFSYLKLVL